MTNEEVFRQFLTHKKAYLNFKLQSYNSTTTIVTVRVAILHSFDWYTAIEGYNYWNKLDDEWIGLCKKFNLKGTIKLKNV